MQKKILTVLVLTTIIALSIIVLRENYYRGYYQGIHDGSPIVLELGVSVNGVSANEVEEVSVSTNSIVEEKEIIEIVYDDEDLRYLSSIIQAEAGNQCEAGQQAVGIVVLNRMNHEVYFADTIKDVIYEKGQFGPVVDGRLNKALKMYDSGILPEKCINAAKYVLDGNTFVSLDGVDFEILDTSISLIDGQILEMNPYLYFNGIVSKPKVRIQGHYFK